MKYAILFYQSPEEFEFRSDPERRKQFWASFLPYMQALNDAGIIVGGAGLQDPHTTTTILTRAGEQIVQDGPFADTKEQLAGFFLIEVPDLDTALSWAARYPPELGGITEVRPCLPPMEP